MFSKILDALAVTDTASKAEPQFAAEYQLNMPDLQIELNDSGPIQLPLADADINNLLNVAKLAKFGLGEKTLEDTSIRDTYEIPADKLTVQFNQNAIDKMLETIHSTLGLPENAALTLHLHNLLIYSPGQFFKIHQDSEKMTGMIATLVVVLPSPHIGGDLIIHQRKKSHRFISEHLKTEVLQTIAFYADCHHEIKRVRQGYRVALTFNLALKSHNQSIAHSNFHNKALEMALKDYFDLNIPANPTPTTLAYFLDHEYSEHGLAWEMLKGIDNQNALSFLQAAKKLNLKAHLALVEIHESWSTDGDTDEPNLEELIEDNFSFSYWLDENNTSLLYKNLTLSDDEFCWTKETHAFEPVETEYEGWMGNYGNTATYWYRRAAIILWREKDQIAMDFQLNYDKAFENLLLLTKKPKQKQIVLGILNKIGDYIFQSKYKINLDNFLQLMDIACYIQEKNIAQFLLERFNLEILNLNCIKKIAELEKTYGVDTCLSLLENWVKPENKFYSIHHDDENPQGKLNELIRYALKIGIDPKIPAFLINHQLLIMQDNDKQSLNSFPASQKKYSAARLNSTLWFFRSCFLVKSSHNAIEKWITHLKTNSNLYSVLDLAEIYFSLKKDIPQDYLDTFNSFCEHIAESLQRELEEGLRKEDDWSIIINLRCRCEHCKITQSFLRSKTESKKIWPLVQQYRNHISDCLRNLDLPIEIHVEEKGRPYTLVITKTDQLYKAAKNRWQKLLSCSKKLKGIKI